MDKSCYKHRLPGYKCCAVPMCKSTSISTPQKLFINVPKIAQVRKKWLTLARRDPASLTTTSTAHFCEDHFDLQNDMENYIEYTTMGVVSRIKMRPGCLPTNFVCQPKSPSTSTDLCRPAAAFQQSENIDTVLPSQDKGPVQEQQQISKNDKAINSGILYTQSRDNPKIPLFYIMDLNRVPKTEEIDISEQFIDGKNIYERQEYITNFNSFIKSESNICMDSCSVKKTEDGFINKKNIYDIKLEHSYSYKEEEESQDSRHELILKPYKCHLCDYTANGKVHINGHLDSVHSKLMQYQCHECNYSASQKGHLKAHMDSIHLNLKQYKCQECDYSAGWKGDLKVHIGAVHLNLKQHQCPFCDYSASKRGTLKVHIDSIHFNLKQHKCHLCDYASSDKGNVKRHKDAVHLKMKPHQCHLCDYFTSNKGSLKRHIDGVHSKLTRSLNINLKKHFDSVHLKLKQHECHLCDYAARQKTTLREHIQAVHLNLKQHECDYSANHKGNLKKHIDSIHLKLKHQCHLCNHAASTKRNLKTHIDCVHLKLKDHSRSKRTS